MRNSAGRSVPALLTLGLCVVVAVSTTACGGASDPVADSSSAAQPLRSNNASDTSSLSIALSGTPTVDPSGLATLQGTVTDKTPVKSVTWVSDKGFSGVATLSGSPSSPAWSASGIQLQSGDNTITVTAQDNAGHSVSATTVVSYSPPVAAQSAGGGATSPAPTSTAPVPTGTGLASLTWDAPVTAANGSAITSLAGYRIYYGTASGNYTGSIYVAGASSLGGSVTGLGVGTWYFTVAAVDTQGNESNLGYELSKTL